MIPAAPQEIVGKAMIEPGTGQLVDLTTERATGTIHIPQLLNNWL
jgi:hypothetical protein